MKYLILLTFFCLSCIKKNTESEVNFAIFNNKMQFSYGNNYIKLVSDESKVEYCFLRYTNDLNEENKKRLEITENIFIEYIEDSIINITGALVDFNVNTWTKKLANQYETDIEKSDTKKLKHSYWKSKSPIIPILNQNCVKNRNDINIFNNSGARNKIISVVIYFEDEINDQTIEEINDAYSFGFTKNNFSSFAYSLYERLTILLVIKEKYKEFYKHAVLHELLHLFGLADTYNVIHNNNNTIRTIINDTANNQPSSIMHGSIYNQEEFKLTTDDKYGLWYSLDLANNIEITKCPEEYNQEIILNNIQTRKGINCIFGKKPLWWKK